MRARPSNRLLTSQKRVKLHYWRISGTVATQFGSSIGLAKNRARRRRYELELAPTEAGSAETAKADIAATPIETHIHWPVPQSGPISHTSRPHMRRAHKERVMESRFIRVTQGADKSWAVLRGPRGISLLRFAIKSHAVAYARTVSLAGKLTLFVDDKYGAAVRQLPSTKDYRKILN